MYIFKIFGYSAEYLWIKVDPLNSSIEQTRRRVRFNKISGTWFLAKAIHIWHIFWMSGRHIVAGVAPSSPHVCTLHLHLSVLLPLPRVTRLPSYFRCQPSWHLERAIWWRFESRGTFGRLLASGCWLVAIRTVASRRRLAGLGVHSAACCSALPDCPVPARQHRRRPATTSSPHTAARFL
jgi:hypothetical protein